MSVTLNIGLSDTSTELGENTVKTSSDRVTHYNNAVIEFFNERKWPFGTKKDNTSLTTQANVASYSLASITDMRMPGPLKRVKINNVPFTPISAEEAEDSKYAGKNFCWIDEEDNTLNFTSAPTVAGLAIELRYWYIPARQTNLNTGTFPVPDRYRKVVAYLAAAYIQWARYLTAQGDNKYNLYLRSVGKTTRQQAERNKNHPRNIKHFLAYRGFRRTYPH